MPKIMLVSDHYARVMLAEISPLNPRYHPNESPKLKTQHFNIFVLLLPLLEATTRLLAKSDACTLLKEAVSWEISRFLAKIH